MAAPVKSTGFRPAFAPRALDRTRVLRVEEAEPAIEPGEHRAAEPIHQTSLSSKNKLHNAVSESGDEELIERESWQAQSSAAAPAIKSRATVQKASADIAGSSKVLPPAISTSSGKPLQPQAFLRHAVRSRDDDSIFSETASVVSGSSDRLAGINGAAAGPQGPLRKTLRDFISDDFTGQSSGKLQAAVAAARTARKEGAARPHAAPIDGAGGDKEDSQPRAKSSGPQLQIVNGQVVMDPSSWIIGTHSHDDDNDLVHMEDLGEGMYITSTTFSKRRPTDRWTVKDTETFYHALREFGTDFSTISTLFSGRDRVSIRAKFNKELKLHPKLIDAALRLALPMDLAATQEAVAIRLAEEKASESQDEDEVLDDAAVAATAGNEEASDEHNVHDGGSRDESQGDESIEHVSYASQVGHTDDAELDAHTSPTHEDFDSFGPAVNAGSKRKRKVKDAVVGVIHTGSRKRKATE